MKNSATSQEISRKRLFFKLTGVDFMEHIAMSAQNRTIESLLINVDLTTLDECSTEDLFWVADFLRMGVFSHDENPAAVFSEVIEHIKLFLLGDESRAKLNSMTLASEQDKALFFHELVRTWVSCEYDNWFRLTRAIIFPNFLGMNVLSDIQSTYADTKLSVMSKYPHLKGYELRGGYREEIRKVMHDVLKKSMEEVLTKRSVRIKQ